MTQKLTPAQRQYLEIKSKYKDCILFFRMWDFYETFYEDAKICSKILDIALTTRDKNSPNPIPMAGVPYHSADKYIKKLVENWYKVAIAEQVWPVKPWQIVNREVVAVITPWTFIDDDKIEDYNFIVGITVKQINNDYVYLIAFGDFTIWEYRTAKFENIEELKKFLFKIQPKEIIFDIDMPSFIKEDLTNWIKNFLKSYISIYDKPHDSEDFVKNMLWIQKIKAFWKALEGDLILAFSLLLNYLVDLQKTSLKNIVKIGLWTQQNEIYIDDVTIRNLEIFKSSYEGNEKYSLYYVINNTFTSMGSRYLKQLLLKPTRDLKLLKKRYDDLKYVHSLDLENIEKRLVNIWDINRLVSKILYKKNLPSLFVKLKNYLILWLEISKFLWDRFFDEKVNIIEDFVKKINAILKEEIINDEIDFVKDWYDNQIDELRKIAYHSDELLVSYQQELVKYFWVPVKIKFINNQGYFIEVSKKDITLLEKKIDSTNPKFNLIRRQTLKSVERYTSTYLSDIESKILTATERLKELEKQVLDNLKEDLQNIVDYIYQFSDIIAYIDVLIAMAKLLDQNRIIPEIKSGFDIKIVWGRHPVVEKYLPIDQQFVPNDLIMDKGENWYIHIITGPNMGWKSTFLRQNALIVYLAHCGLPVPAKEAIISLVDWIFARVGSWDVIAKNQSTFMTEMIEVAGILHNATKNSFIILDELGRWTSTYDWLALARAIVEFISEKIGSKTLFATHYHELIQLEWKVKWVTNWSVAVYETDKDVVFLKKIIRWGASKSYGIEVAKLAGLPDIVIKRAEEYLKQLETKISSSDKPKQIWLFDKIEPTLIEELKKIKEENEKLKNILRQIRNLIVEIDL